MKAIIFTLLFLLPFLSGAQHKNLPVEDLSRKSKKELVELFDIYNSKINNDSKDAKSYFDRSYLKYYTGDSLNAILDIQKAININHRSAVYHYMYAYEIVDQKQYNITINECDSAIKYDKTYVDAYGLKGLALSELGKPLEAREQFKKVLSLDSTYKLTYSQLAYSYYKTNEFNEAMEIVNLLLTKDPEYEEGLTLKSNIYMAQKKYHDAISVSDKLIKIKKSVLSSYVLKANAYDSLKNQKEACKCVLNALFIGYIDGYEYIMKKCPAEQENIFVKSSTYELQAVEFENQGNYVESMRLFNEVIKLMPDSGMPYYNRGKLKRKMEDHKGAIEDYLIAIKKAPNFSPSYIATGVSYTFLGDLESSKKYYLTCMKVDPLNEMAYYNYADILTSNEKNYKEAIYYYKFATDLKPDYTKAHYWLGECYSKLGMNTEACESFKIAEKLGDVRAISQRLWYCNH